MFGNVGFVFDFENTADESISPLCYYPTDGSSNHRLTNSGCGPIGVQWSPTPLSSKGYANNEVVLPSFDEMDDEKKSQTKAALDYPGFLNTIRQPSLNFRRDDVFHTRRGLQSGSFHTRIAFSSDANVFAKQYAQSLASQGCVPKEFSKEFRTDSSRSYSSCYISTITQ
jgi:hypothetical protein